MGRPRGFRAFSSSCSTEAGGDRVGFDMMSNEVGDQVRYRAKHTKIDDGLTPKAGQHPK